jgi:uncharacterized protein
MKTKVPDPEMIKKLFPVENVILCGLRGSMAQNTYVPSTDPNSVDDIDLMGIYLAPKSYYIGLGKGKRYRKAIERFINEWDVVSYELRKFVNLLLKSNPNVLSLLWIKSEDYIDLGKDIMPRLYKVFGEDLVSNRDLFSSKLAYRAFTGYAYGQMKRMEKKNKEGYMGAKREELVNRFGYDVKNASHLIRLLKMGIEFLDTGKLNVFRSVDAEELIDIKTGKWTLEDIKKYSKDLFEKAKTVYNSSPLPEEPDCKKVEEILEDTLMAYLC